MSVTIYSRHPKTSALATLLWRADLTDYDTTAEAIEQLFSGMLDVVKAELYARLQDTLDKFDTFAETERKINEALRHTLRAF